MVEVTESSSPQSQDCSGLRGGVPAMSERRGCEGRSTVACEERSVDEDADCVVQEAMVSDCHM